MKICKTYMWETSQNNSLRQLKHVWFVHTMLIKLSTKCDAPKNYGFPSGNLYQMANRKLELFKKSYRYKRTLYFISKNRLNVLRVSSGSIGFRWRKMVWLAHLKIHLLELSSHVGSWPGWPWLNTVALHWTRGNQR